VIVPLTTASFKQLAEIIERGGTIAFRTDTFYGLGVNPFNEIAVQKIKQLKGREEHKPILVLISDQDQIARFISQRSPAFDSLAARYWPGPLTLIGKASNYLSEALTAGTKTVGVRLPDDDQVRELLRECGGALTGTSANPSGHLPARTAGEVEKYFGDRVDLTVDGGEAKTDRPSTIIDCTADRARLIREGVISWADIAERS
jgi:L-threonylcarbamoyladenylate synthase